MLLESALAAAALVLALATRPWRQLAGGPENAEGQRRAPALLTPLLAILVVLPWMWAMPTLHAMPLQLQWSGACLVVLLLGWPLAVLVLFGVGAITWLIAPISLPQALLYVVWQGIVPGTFGLLLGALIRRFTGEHLFVYVLGRAFLGTAVCVFAAGVLAQWAGKPLPGVGSELSLVARWLMAWGDGTLTGMVCAVFVAFKPEWLATWSDTLYLHRPPPPPPSPPPSSL